MHKGEGTFPDPNPQMSAPERSSKGTEEWEYVHKHVL